MLHWVTVTCCFAPSDSNGNNALKSCVHVGGLASYWTMNSKDMVGALYLLRTPPPKAWTIQACASCQHFAEPPGPSRLPHKSLLRWRLRSLRTDLAKGAWKWFVLLPLCSSKSETFNVIPCKYEHLATIDDGPRSFSSRRLYHASSIANPWANIRTGFDDWQLTEDLCAWWRHSGLSVILWMWNS